MRTQVAGNCGFWLCAQLLLLISRDDTHAYWHTYMQLPCDAPTPPELPSLASLAQAAWLNHLHAQVSELAAATSGLRCTVLRSSSGGSNSPLLLAAAAAATPPAAQQQQQLCVEISGRGAAPAVVSGSLSPPAKQGSLDTEGDALPSPVKHQLSGSGTSFADMAAQLAAAAAAAAAAENGGVPPTARAHNWPALPRVLSGGRMPAAILPAPTSVVALTPGLSVLGPATTPTSPTKTTTPCSQHTAASATAVPAHAAAAAEQVAVTGPPSSSGVLAVTVDSAGEEVMGVAVCEVCFEQPALLRLRACGHLLCTECSKRVVSMEAGRKPATHTAPRCPWCQQHIQGFQLSGAYVQCCAAAVLGASPTKPPTCDSMVHTTTTIGTDTTNTSP